MNKNHSALAQRGLFTIQIDYYFKIQRLQMYGPARYQHEVLLKTRQVLMETVAQMQKCPTDKLSQDDVKQIQMRFKALIVDLKKAKVEIPFIALERNDTQCLNKFNKKQLPIVETQVNKAKAMVHNFDSVCRLIQIGERRKKEQNSTI